MNDAGKGLGMPGQPATVVRVEVNGRPHWGVLEATTVVDLPDGPFGDSPRRGRVLGALQALRLLAPTVPSKVICVARNYVAHAAEHRVDVPESPLLFFKPPSAVVGPGATIELPSLSERVEHEGELAVIIGRRCRRVDEPEAWQVVLGVCCANDVTARDIQRAEKLWTRGKGFDTFCPLGPWITVLDDQEGVADLEIRCTVNDELRQLGRTGEMVFSPAQLISYASQVMTLEPGDVILTGTPAGVGPIAVGDTVTVAIEGLGELSNPVGPEAE
jgi:2-keto-4-pentenoate hydratase/2-oxohepta-3-ene-1,7-dioic acid hydratase in catechol pathway